MWYKVINHISEATGACGSGIREERDSVTDRSTPVVFLSKGTDVPYRLSEDTTSGAPGLKGELGSFAALFPQLMSSCQVRIKVPGLNLLFPGNEHDLGIVVSFSDSRSRGLPLFCAKPVYY